MSENPTPPEREALADGSPESTPQDQGLSDFAKGFLEEMTRPLLPASMNHTQTVRRARETKKLHRKAGKIKTPSPEAQARARARNRAAKQRKKARAGRKTRKRQR